jgi:hypothetical protein
MIFKRLVEILKSFDKDELKKFGRFIRSDYFNTNERITELFKALKKSYPDFDNPKPTNEYLFKQIYGTRNYDDKTFRYLLAELLELAKKFVALSIIEGDMVEVKKNIIIGLLSRALYSQASSLLKASEEKLDMVPLISGDYLSNKIEYYDLWSHLFFLTNKQEPLLNKRIEQADHLTIHNLIELFHLFRNIHTDKVNFNVEPEDNVMFAFVNNFNYKGMLDYLDNMEKTRRKDKNHSNLINAFKIYLCFMITFLDEKDEEYFYKMRDLVNEYGGYFDREELQNIHIYLLSICNAKRKTINEDKYLRNYFEIVKQMDSLSLFTSYKGQYMDVSGFYRIFQTALYLKEYTWAENFIVKYAGQLAPEFSEDLKNYANAELSFRQNRFEESLKQLARVKFKFYRLKVNVRSLMLMIYYELDYIEEAFSLTDSFAHFLTGSKKIVPAMREASTNFLSYSRELLKYKTAPKNKKKLSELKNNIANCTAINNKDWILEKVKELEKTTLK